MYGWDQNKVVTLYKIIKKKKCMCVRHYFEKIVFTFRHLYRQLSHLALQTGQAVFLENHYLIHSL